MTNIKPVLRDPSPEVLARHARKLAERLARAERRMIARLMRLIGWPPDRCPICGAMDERATRERCKGACEL